MRAYDVITKKKRGETLTKEEIRFFIEEYTRGDIPDYQASALLMAICLRGMSDKETADLTLAIAESGDIIDLSEFGNLTVDKHSTGGVGDKTTLIVAPILASLGAKVAKMSGRGLGHTGGTVDKLESFPGYNTSLTPKEFKDLVGKIGIAVTGQSEKIAPADKKLYALRDVTATVDSIPLIASSIMGKKLALGSHSIVLDVKCGSGAFLKNPKEAECLAEKMVNIGKAAEKNVAALITDMDVPLGFAVGNILEVVEALSVLRGGGPADLKEVSVALATAMARLSLGLSEGEAKERVVRALSDGSAFRKFKEWISAQGGDASFADRPELFPTAKFSREIKAERQGYVSRMNAELIGSAALVLGAGRVRKNDSIDLSCGILLARKVSDFVSPSDTVATIYTNREEMLDEAERIFMASLEISDSQPKERPLVYKIVT